MVLKFAIAAGWVKTPAEAKKFAKSGVDVLEMGSYTITGSDGNQGGRNFHHSEDMSVVMNSIGLRNQGLPMFLKKDVGEVFSVVPKTMELSVSVAAFSVVHYQLSVKMLAEAGIRRMCINMGCPNGFSPDGTPKRIISFDLEAVANVFADLRVQFLRAKHRPHIAVKPSPFSDPFQLKDFAQLVNKCGVIDEVIASNTFPNAYALEADGTPYLGVAGGYGGLSGTCMKQVSIGQVMQFKKYLHSGIEVSGANGVHSGQDALDYERAGASMVYVGSSAFIGGPRAVNRIIEVYANL